MDVGEQGVGGGGGRGKVMDVGEQGVGVVVVEGR